MVLFMDYTFVMIKPSGVERKLIGRIIQRFEDKNLKIERLELKKVNKNFAERFYNEHKGKDFYNDLITTISDKYVVGMVISGTNAIEIVRKLVGNTIPHLAEPGTIRGDFACQLPDNVIHASDSPESAKREINIFFNSMD